MTREEAINVVRSIYQTDAEKEALAILIPELRESEDERIRKGLFKLMTVAGGNYVLSATGFEKERILAYLKKNKEQKLPQWKPSEGQMSMLLAVVNDPNNAGSESCHLSLKSLYNDLKKL